MVVEVENEWARSVIISVPISGLMNIPINDPMYHPINVPKNDPEGPNSTPPIAKNTVLFRNPITLDDIIVSITPISTSVPMSTLISVLISVPIRISKNSAT